MNVTLSIFAVIAVIAAIVYFVRKNRVDVPESTSEVDSTEEESSRIIPWKKIIIAAVAVIIIVAAIVGVRSCTASKAVPTATPTAKTSSLSKSDEELLASVKAAGLTTAQIKSLNKDQWAVINELLAQCKAHNVGTAELAELVQAMKSGNFCYECLGILGRGSCQHGLDADSANESAMNHTGSESYTEDSNNVSASPTGGVVDTTSPNYGQSQVINGGVTADPVPGTPHYNHDAPIVSMDNAINMVEGQVVTSKITATSDVEVKKFDVTTSDVTVISGAECIEVTVDGNVASVKAIKAGTATFQIKAGTAVDSDGCKSKESDVCTVVVKEKASSSEEDVKIDTTVNPATVEVAVGETKTFAVNFDSEAVIEASTLNSSTTSFADYSVKQYNTTSYEVSVTGKSEGSDTFSVPEGAATTTAGGKTVKSSAASVGITVTAKEAVEPTPEPEPTPDPEPEDKGSAPVVSLSSDLADVNSGESFNLFVEVSDEDGDAESISADSVLGALSGSAGFSATAASGASNGYQIACVADENFVGVVTVSVSGSVFTDSNGNVAGDSNSVSITVSNPFAETDEDVTFEAQAAEQEEGAALTTSTTEEVAEAEEVVAPVKEAAEETVSSTETVEEDLEEDVSDAEEVTEAEETTESTDIEVSEDEVLFEDEVPTEQSAEVIGQMPIS